MDKDRGFLHHIRRQERCLKANWTGCYRYEISLFIDKFTKDLDWKIPLFYERVIRFVADGKLFGMDALQLDLTCLDLSIFPGASETEYLRYVSRNVQKMAPHSLIAGLIRVLSFFYIHSSILFF